MNNKIVINFQKKYLHIVCFSMAIFTLFFTTLVFAKQYRLQLIVDLSEFNGVSTEAQWLEPLNIPSSGGEFFVAQDNGLIFFAGKENKNNQEAILNLPLVANEPGYISLTALTLHPNFSQPEKNGYATLFTAHTTTFDHKTNYNRLTLSDTSIEFDFETVITAWKYDFDTQIIAPETQREVLRIPLKNQFDAIQHLAFDPYQESWNTDYGQLYFSLKQIEELKEHSLYSGVILRIDPLMYGARNYTVPRTNPFIKELQVNDEIVVMGAQNIEHFFWSKSDHRSIFIQHNNSEQHWLSKTELGKNFLTQSQSNFLWQQPNAMSSMLLYQGRDFLHLRNKMVFFTLLDNQWHLGSKNLVPLNNESPAFEELESGEYLSPTSDLNIHHNKQGEIILFDQQKSSMYSLLPINQKVGVVDASPANTLTDGSNSLVFYLSLLAGGLVLTIFVYRKIAVQERSTLLLEKDHLLLKYEVSNQSVLLIKPKLKNVYKTLSIEDIIRCEVMLNNNVIKIIDVQPESAFSNQSEAEIRALFMKEQNEKMLNENIRLIGIKLFDKDDSYIGCLYLRKGKVRITGAKYNAVIDTLMDLCWNISKQINPQTTEKRIIPLVAFSRPKVAVQQTTKPQSDSHDQANHSIKDPTEFETITETSAVQAMPQTEMVDALDKLVKLHQQGYLSEEEFSLAKAKLLQKLLDT